MTDKTGQQHAEGTVIAIGTDDGMIVCPRHYGMSRKYHLYAMADEGLRPHGIIRNPYADPEKHRHAETDDIMSVLDGVDVCIGRKMGGKSPPIILRYGGTPVLTTVSRITDCLAALHEGRSNCFRIYSQVSRDWVSAGSGTWWASGPRV